MQLIVSADWRIASIAQALEALTGAQMMSHSSSILASSKLVDLPAPLSA